MTGILKIIVRQAHYFILVIVFASVLMLPPPSYQGVISAQGELTEVCEISNIEKNCAAIEPSQCRQLLEKCDEYYKQEAVRIGEDLYKTEKEKQTLQNKVSGLR